MKVIIYYCDICTKRMKKNQKVWFENNFDYHFICKYQRTVGEEGEFIKKHSKKLRELTITI